MPNEGSRNWNDADGRDAALQEPRQQKPLQQSRMFPQGKARLEGEPGAKRAAAAKSLALVERDPRSELAAASVKQGGELASRLEMWK
jgi:hypothetical protein